MEYGLMTSLEVRDVPKEEAVVVIPAGAIEQHGPHLSMGTDTILVTEIARRAAEKVRDRTVALVTPTFWSGCSAHHMEFPGSLTLSTETFVRAVTEIASCFVRHGFRHILILNGHGHNLDPVRLAARNIRDSTSGEVIVAVANYMHFALSEIGGIRESGVGGIAHACELETSCMLAVRPEGVHMELAQKYVPVWKGSYFAMDVSVPRNVYVAHHVADFSPTGVLGDPTLASKEKGERFLEAIAEKVADFIVDFSHWTYASMYELV